MIGNDNNKINLPRKLFLIETQIINFCKSFENNFSDNIKL